MKTKSINPVIEIINLIKIKKISILIIFLITIACSWLYNLNIKKTTYTYSLQFITLSQWRASEIGVDHASIKSLTKNLVLVTLEDYNPRNTFISETDPYSVNFISEKKKNLDIFFTKLEKEMSENIKNLLSDRYSLLKVQRDTVVADIQKASDDKLRKMELDLLGLVEESEIMLELFGNTLEHISNSSNSLEVTDYEIIKNYLLIQKKIINLKNNIKLKSNKKALPLNELYIANKAQLNKLDNSINILENQIKNYESSNIETIIKIGDWTIKDNKLKPSEITIAGILFGILLNCFYLFITSKYLRELKNI